MERALSARGSIAMSASARAKALFVAGMMSNYQGDHLSAEPLVQESFRLFKELGDKLGTAYALSNAGYVALGRGRYQQAITVIEEAADLFLEEGEKWGAAIELGFLAVAWRDQGDHERAKRLAERGLARCSRGSGTGSRCFASATSVEWRMSHRRALNFGTPIYALRSIAWGKMRAWS